MATFRDLLAQAKSQISEVDTAEAQSRVDAGGVIVLDVREPDEYAQGHLPGAINLPYSNLVDPQRGTMLPAEQLRDRIKQAGIDIDKPVIASCGSGVSACILGLALYPQLILSRTDGSVAKTVAAAKGPAGVAEP